MNNQGIYIKDFLSHQTVFGWKASNQQIIDMVRKLPIAPSGIILSQLSAHHYTNPKVVRNIWPVAARLCGRSPAGFAVLMQQNVLYSEQALLQAWKYLLAYADEEQYSWSADYPALIQDILVLIWALSDHLAPLDLDKDNIADYLVQNSAFNDVKDAGRIIGRSKYIFHDLALSPQLYREAEFVNFVNDFRSHLGYSVEDYLAAIIGLITVSRDADFGPAPPRTLNQIFAGTSFENAASKILESLTINHQDAHQRALGTIGNTWDFSLFEINPVLIIPSGEVLIFSYHILIDQVYLGLYWKIRHCYGPHDLNFQRFFGRPFEKNVQMLIESAVSSSLLGKYEFSDDYCYGNGGKKSPDCMIRLGNRLLAIEAKASSLAVGSRITGDSKSIDRDFQKLVLDPYNQLCKCLADMVRVNDAFLEGVDEYHLISVNLRDFPVIKPFEQRIVDILNSEQHLKVKSYCHMDIEELEAFCNQFSGESRRNIFRLLANKQKHFPYVSFRNFLLSSHLPWKFSKFCEDILADAFSMSAKKTFGDDAALVKRPRGKRSKRSAINKSK